MQRGKFDSTNQKSSEIVSQTTHLAGKPVVALPNVGCFSQANRAEDFGILNKLETVLSEQELKVRIQYQIVSPTR